jgi:hypothetical protein
MRYDLIPIRGIEEVHKVLNSKLDKHEVGEWKHGLKWTEVLSSLKKHLLAFEKGEDFTPEGNLSIAEVATNALILSEYFFINPGGDNREFLPINRPIVALDIDDVCLDFIGAFEQKTGIKCNDYWNGSYEMKEKLEELSTDEEFWTTLPTKHMPTFEPDLYITSRSIPVEWTKKNLERNGFPCAPVFCVPWNESKVDLLKQHNVSILCDDKFQNYKDAIDAGVFCYLVDAPHNKYYNVGHRRIYNLNLSIK